MQNKTDLTNAHVVITLDKQTFILKTKDGIVLGTWDSSRQASKYAFAHGADSVAHEYDLKHEK